MRLTTHFSLAELTASTTAARHGIDNDPPDDVLVNLNRLARALERVRHVLKDNPVLVNSGYRCPELNRRVGGVPDSAHVEGRAVDFHAPSFGAPRRVADWLQQHQHSLPEGSKVLLEYDRWIHFRIPKAAPVEFIEANRVNGKTVYRPLGEPEPGREPVMMANLPQG